MNYLMKPFNSINIRQAFALAINKDVIAKDIWKGIRKPTNHIVPQTLPGYDPGLKGVDGTTSTAGNIALARQKLQAGLKDLGLKSVSQLPSITVLYRAGDTDTNNQSAVLLLQFKNALGIDVKFQAIDYNKLLDDIYANPGNANGVQMWIGSWGSDYPDPQDWTSLQFGKGSQQNEVNYGQNQSPTASNQQQVQTLLANADGDTNPSTRFSKYNRAEQQLVNDVAWLPLVQRTTLAVEKSYVIGHVISPAGLTPDVWARIYITNH